MFRGKRNYSGIRVSDDGLWLIAGNGQSLVWGSVADVPEARHGVTYDGDLLSVVSRAIPRNAVVLDFPEDDKGVVFWDGGGPYRVPTAQYGFPSPDNLIPDLSLDREPAIPRAFETKALAKSMRAVAPFRTTMLFGRDIYPHGGWVVAKSGMHELRIFNLPAFVSDEGWPQ